MRLPVALWALTAVPIRSVVARGFLRRRTGFGAAGLTVPGAVVPGLGAVVPGPGAGVVGPGAGVPVCGPGAGVPEAGGGESPGTSFTTIARSETVRLREVARSTTLNGALESCGS